jgi:hypothetical protein
MRSPALAIAWEFRRRHRWGLVALAGYLVALAIIRFLILESGQRVNLDTPESFGFIVVVPLAATFTYFLAVFTFGFAGDLAARESIYPPRAFTLPVTNAALAGWPMLYGTAAMAVLWLAMRLLAVWPSGVAVPTVWPALLAAALLAWTQALTWMPYGLPGLRVIVAMSWLATIDAVVLLALQYRAPESFMIGILAPQIPAAYLVARSAVARARRGDVPDWRPALARLGRIAAVRPDGRERFATPARAQAWFEWRRHGRSLPALVGVVLPFELALLFVAGDAPALIFAIVLGVLLTPPFLAVFSAATVPRSTSPARDPYGISAFIATRPLTGAALVAAKLEGAAWSTVAAWLLVLVATPPALILSDTWSTVIDRARQGVALVGMPRAIVIVLLTLSGLVASTWKHLVQGLYVGLTGRAWAVKGSVFLALSFLFLLGPIVQWIVDNPGVRRALWDALPAILAIVVGVKMSAAAWIVTRLARRRLLSDRTLVAGAACWSVAVFALYGLLVWLIATPFFPHYLLALVAILAMPLARLAAAPLALASNRHR